MMSKNHEIQILCAITHDMLELTLDHAMACFGDCWEIKVKRFETVVLYVKDVAYGDNVLLPVTVESSIDNNDYVRWERDGDGVRSPVFAPEKTLRLIVSAATGTTQSKKSTTVIVIKTGRPDVDDV